MASWIVGRLVSGLGVATKAAALPLARQTASDLVPCSIVPTVSSTLRCWSALDHGLGCNRPATAFLSTSAASTAQASHTMCAEASAAAVAQEAAGPSAVGAADSATASTSSEAAAPEPPSAPLPDPKPELVEMFLSSEVLGLQQQRRLERQAVAREFQRHPADTGSPQVMVALMTHRLRELVLHFDSNRKQLPAMRHLEILANQRRRLLTWLRDADFESYSYTITKLGLQDIYTPTGISDRYREGVRHGDPVTDEVIRMRFNFHSKYRQRKASLWQRLRPQLVAEDPHLQAVDAATAAAEKQRQQRQRIAAATQRV